jgi:hypothetical protein
MPREFLPQQRKREPQTRAEMFPRGERGVVTHGKCGMGSAECGVPERRQVKRTLRELALRSGDAEYPASVE